MRLKLVDLARKIVDITTTIQEIDGKLQDVTVKRNKRRITESKLVKYWAFIAILEKKKVKIIIRQIGEGKIHFWSLIPFWTTTEYENHKFMNYTKGDLENE